MKYIFFDLDGTIVDSSVGIHNAFVQTFERLNLPVPNTKTIQSFMGPPLEVTFEKEVGQENAERAIKIYREYYKEKGQFEVALYPAIKELLEYLADNKQFKIFITTSKNEPISLQMCQHLNITNYFDGIYGSTPSSYHKEDVLKRAIQENNAPKNQSIIIGDTKFDIIGGKAVGIKTLAATWGFGSKNSLLAEEPDHIADTIEQVLTILEEY